MSRLGNMYMGGNRIEFCWNDGTDILGSDGVCGIDARLGLDRLIEYGRKVLKSRKNVKPSMTGMSIYKKGRCIYSNRWEII